MTPSYRENHRTDTCTLPPRPKSGADPVHHGLGRDSRTSGRIPGLSVIAEATTRHVLDGNAARPRLAVDDVLPDQRPLAVNDGHRVRDNGRCPCLVVEAQNDQSECCTALLQPRVQSWPIAIPVILAVDMPSTETGTARKMLFDNLRNQIQHQALELSFAFDQAEGRCIAHLPQRKHLDGGNCFGVIDGHAEAPRQLVAHAMTHACQIAHLAVA